MKSDRRANRAASYAKRFAAKEACSKALGTGFRRRFLARSRRGEPQIGQADNGADRRCEGAMAQIDLTITDDFPLAQAVVIISAVPVEFAVASE